MFRKTTLLQLIKHLNNEHDSHIKIERLHFNNWLEFDAWKADEEKQTRSYYVQDSSAKMYGSSKHHYFYCNTVDLVTMNPKGTQNDK